MHWRVFLAAFMFGLVCLPRLWVFVVGCKFGWGFCSGLSLGMML